MEDHSFSIGSRRHVQREFDFGGGVEGPAFKLEGQEGGVSPEGRQPQRAGHQVLGRNGRGGSGGRDLAPQRKALRREPERPGRP